MNYFIERNGQQYGPYTLADLQRYVASGQILLTDMAFTEGATAGVPVSQIVGTPAPVVPANMPYAPLATNRNPPNLHWALVLLFSIFSCGLFSAIWNLVQAEWMKKVDPESKAMGYYLGAIGVLVVTVFLSFQLAYRHGPNTGAGVMNLVYLGLLIVGRFSLKASLEKYYNTVEPIGLVLSGVMVFFFGDIYFQYHFNKIMERKQAAAYGRVPM
jgi:hypothetical protein